MSDKPRKGYQAGDTVPLADELFILVERDQGKAHISDGIGVLDDAAIMRIARQSFDIHRRLARKLNRWIKRREKGGKP